MKNEKEVVKKKIRIAIVDFAPKEGYLAERLLGMVTDRYDFEITENDPDFVLHSCMGNKALKFDAVRIFYTAENFTPDFNLSDYALGMDPLVFGDRYHMLPLYRLYFDTYSKILQARTLNDEKEFFCTCVVSNARRETSFFDLFKALEKHKHVASGGRVLNNVGGRVPDKLKFMKQGRFGLAFENSIAPGYITEKLTDVYAAGSIPIYLGAPDIEKYFNPYSFINISKYDSIEDAVKEIIEIDQDEKRYLAMLNASVFIDGVEPSFLKEDAIKKFLSSIFDQNPEQAYRRNRMIRGEIYLKKLRTAFFKPHVQASRLIRGWIRKKRKVKTFIAPIRITSEGVVYADKNKLE